jgi:Domain of unknown function (DUF4893)
MDNTVTSGSFARHSRLGTLRSVVCVLLIVSAGCARRDQTAQLAAAVPTSDWRAVATPQDKKRLHGWRDAFVKALDDAKSQGHGEKIAREGALLLPDAAREGRGPPPGEYSCRVIKLGRKGAYTSGFLIQPTTACVIAPDGPLLRFTKMTGPQRPAGHIFPGNELRQIFLGSMALGDEVRPMAYGRDDARDLAGAVEWIGGTRWRLILPEPRLESMMTIIEIIPAG